MAPAQRRFISFPEGQRYAPIRAAPSGERNRGPCSGAAALFCFVFRYGHAWNGSCVANICYPPPSLPLPAGFVVLRDTQPDAGEAEYLFEEEKPAAAPAAPSTDEAAPAAAPPAAGAGSGDEPPPPEPFEYIPS